ncbi:unnamed protein product [Peniophora sp. CBMAI 1063]|nr:unnamed protein product [Peniophora sp. CBMAI 1063]
MPLDIVNLTSQPITFEVKKKAGRGQRIVIPAHGRVEVKKPKHGFSLVPWDLNNAALEKKPSSENSALLGSASHTFSLRRPLSFGAAIQMLTGSDASPWLVYKCKVENRRTIHIVKERDMRSYLSDLPDATSLTDLCLPGTHDTMAFYGWPISQCQASDTPLPVQLQQGIRILDIRLAVIKGRLIAYHGAYPQRTTFASILATLSTFLHSAASRRETLIVSIKQEDRGGDFSRLVREEIEHGPGGMGMWWLENRIPALGEVRGKAILFSRFGGNGADWPGGLEGMGIHPTTWPDSAKEGFEWWCKDTMVRTQDWYSIPSFLDIPEKTALAVEVLKPPQQAPMPVLSISFFSAASPLAVPPLVATGWGWPSIGLGVEGVNSRISRFLLRQLGMAARRVAPDEEPKAPTDEPLIRGWTFIDFYRLPSGSAIVPLLVECNFIGR